MDENDQQTRFIRSNHKKLNTFSLLQKKTGFAKKNQFVNSKMRQSEKKSSMLNFSEFFVFSFKHDLHSEEGTTKHSLQKH